MTESVSKLSRLEAALRELPVFPLPQAVLFPRALLPLHIFEPRYRTMLKDCLETHSAMVVALIPDPRDVDSNGNPRIAPVAGGGVIIEHQQLADGRSNILLHGLARLRLEELPFVPPYRRARGTILADLSTSVSTGDRTALVAAATAFAGEVHKRDPNFSLRLPPSLEAGAIADLCAHHLVIDAAARQRILEELDAAERVRLVIGELAIQHGALLKEGGGLLH
jgi:ATP-dependent Lon protease